MTNLFRTNEFSINGEQIKVVRETKKNITITKCSINTQLVVFRITHKKVIVLTYSYNDGKYYDPDNKVLMECSNIELTTSNARLLKGILSYQGRTELTVSKSYIPKDTLLLQSNPDKVFLRKKMKVIS